MFSTDPAPPSLVLSGVFKGSGATANGNNDDANPEK
jgi:hypothetical protein